MKLTGPRKAVDGRGGLRCRPFGVGLCVEPEGTAGRGIDFLQRPDRAAHTALEPWLLRPVVAKLADKGMAGHAQAQWMEYPRDGDARGQRSCRVRPSVSEAAGQEDRSGGTSPGGHIPARAGGAGAAEVQPIAEHPEQRLTAREQEFWGTLQTTLRQSEDRCTALSASFMPSRASSEAGWRFRLPS